MHHLIIRKIKNKKSMTFCLVFALALLVAVFSCQPMYKEGTLNRVLTENFSDYIASDNSFPTALCREEVIAFDDGTKIDGVEEKYDTYREAVSNYLGFLGRVAGQRIVTTEAVYRVQRGYPDSDRKVHYPEDDYSDGTVARLAYMEDLEKHIVLYGSSKEDEIFSMPSYSSENDKVYPVLLSRKTMESRKLFIGEELRINNLTDSNGKALKLYVSGVFDCKETDKVYFFKDISELSENLYLSHDSFCEIVENYNIEEASFDEYDLFDYTKINSANISDVEYYINAITGSVPITETFTQHLENYKKSKDTVSVTLWALELPLIGMLIAFIYMISSEIIESEAGEIAMHKSRGLSGFQIFLIYLYQNLLLSAAGLILGLVLGYGICMVAGCATSFLVFDFSTALSYRPVFAAVLYGLLAILIGLIFILIPVVKSSRVSIVYVKSNYDYSKKPFWEKVFLDVILLLLSLYLLYNFRKDIEGIRADALAGKMTDPMIFLNICILFVSLGLLLCRIIKYIVKWIYALGKKHFGYTAYAAFLQVIRNSKKQSLISVFLIMTVALGIFYSNVAGTINSNNVKRIEYECAGDSIVHEQWPVIVYKDSAGNVQYKYKEPPFGRYMDLKRDGYAQSVTAVIENNSTRVVKNGKEVSECTVWGIHTKEFGQTAAMADNLNKNAHWYTYLNALAEESTGVIISQNLADKAEIKVGDIIDLDRYGEFERFKDQLKGSMKVKVVAIVENWPGYERYVYNPELTEKYLAIVNYELSEQINEISPYSVWIAPKEGVSTQDIRQRLKETGDGIFEISGSDEEISRMKASLSIQIINGMFSTGFIVALIVCGAGFLIFWITSIKERELLFGVYRAMGVPVKKINQMLFVEHVFSTLFSCIAGIAEGILATILYRIVFVTVYLPKKHNIPIESYFSVADVVRLASFLLVMLLVCALCLRHQTKSLNITNALKLGEE